MKIRTMIFAGLLLAVILAGCSASNVDEPATEETAATTETATGETAIEYDLGLADDGYFEGVIAEKYIKMPKDWEKYTVDEAVYTVSDEDLQNELDYFKSAYQLTLEVDRPAQDGDVVNISYEGSINGVPFTGGTSTDYDLELGSDSFIDGFEDQIVGHSKGDEFDVTVMFPDGYPSTTDRETGETEIPLANQEAVFHVVLNSVSQYDVTDADVADIMSGYTLEDGTPVTTVDLLKQYAEEGLRMQQVSANVQDYFIKNATLKRDIDKLVDANLETNRQYITNEAEMYGMDVNTYVSTYSESASLDDYIESMRSDVEDNVKLSLCAQYMAEKQDYKPTEEEVRAYIGDNYDTQVETYGAGPLAQECLYNKIMGTYCQEVYQRSIA